MQTTFGERLAHSGDRSLIVTAAPPRWIAEGRSRPQVVFLAAPNQTRLERQTPT